MFGFPGIYHIQWISLDLTIKISTLLFGKVKKINYKLLSSITDYKVCYIGFYI